MPAPTQTKRILVVFSKFDFSHRQMLGGILKYAHDICASAWTTRLELLGTSRRGAASLRNGRFDGIIAAVVNPADRRKYLSAGIPVVLYEPTLAKWDRTPRPPNSITFFNDHTAEGRTAAEYFVERGYRSFAYVGTPEPVAWSEARRRGFVSTLAKRGLKCRVFPQSGAKLRGRHDQEPGRLLRWLAKLPPHTALFAVHDERLRKGARRPSARTPARPRDTHLPHTRHDAAVHRLLDNSRPLRRPRRRLHARQPGEFHRRHGSGRRRPLLAEDAADADAFHAWPDAEGRTFVSSPVRSGVAPCEHIDEHRASRARLRVLRRIAPRPSPEAASRRKAVRRPERRRGQRGNHLHLARSLTPRPDPRPGLPARRPARRL